MTRAAAAPFWSRQRSRQAHASRAHSAPLVIKSPAQVEEIRAACRIASEALRMASRACLPGATTHDVDEAARKVILAAGAQPLFLGYRQGNSPPFPSCTCVSVNEEVVHGIPGPRELAPGDLVKIDVGLRSLGWCADVATTVLLPGGPAEIDAPRRRLVDCTRAILHQAIKAMKPGVRWSQVARLMERHAADHGLRIITGYVGHGIGRELHEGPRVPAYWTGFDGEDFELVRGMVLAVEPLLCAGSAVAHPSAPSASDSAATSEEASKNTLFAPIAMREDRWTVVTADGAAASHEERIVSITDGGGDVLTMIDDASAAHEPVWRRAPGADITLVDC